MAENNKKKYFKKKDGNIPVKKRTNTAAPVLKVIPPHNGPLFKYIMSQESANLTLETRKGDDFKMSVQDYLCKFVNDEYGLLGYCIEVNVSI